MGPVSSDSPEPFKPFFEELEWAVEFNFNIRKTPRTIKAPPRLLLESNVTGVSLCEIVSALKLDLYLYMGMETSLDYPERARAYEHQFM